MLRSFFYKKSILNGRSLTLSFLLNASVDSFTLMFNKIEIAKTSRSSHAPAKIANF